MLLHGSGRYRCFLTVQDSCCCFWIIVVGSIWLLMILYSVGCLWPVLDGRGRLWPVPWLLYRELPYFKCCLSVMTGSSCCLLVKKGFSCFLMFLQILHGSRWFCTVVGRSRLVQLVVLGFGPTCGLFF